MESLKALESLLRLGPRCLSVVKEYSYTITGKCSFLVCTDMRPDRLFHHRTLVYIHISLSGHSLGHHKIEYIRSCQRRVYSCCRTVYYRIDKFVSAGCVDFLGIKSVH